MSRDATADDLAIVPPATGPPWEPIDWHSLFAGDADDPERWLVEPVLPVGRQVAIYSEPKLGKSLLALDVAAGLASGRGALGGPECEPTPVLYIDAEMTPEDLLERVIDLGYGPEDLTQLAYYQLVDLPPFDTPAGGAAIAQLLDRHSPSLVVIDTMTSLTDGPEDNNDTIRDFYRHTGRVVKERGIALLRLDHRGKDRTAGQRGASHKAGDVDVVFAMSIKGSVVTLTRTHSRPKWVPGEVRMERQEEPVLRHVLAATPDESRPGVSNDDRIAELLDDLNVPIEASKSIALAALRADGHKARDAVVLRALRLRRERS